jgi:molybdopterin/thiamine biosynthesis adenylyltransferase
MLTNLQRQVAHTLARVGEPKVAFGARRDGRDQPRCCRHAGAAACRRALLDTLVPLADVVLDCTDNFATRHAINRACVRHHKPLVSGAAIRFDGQISASMTRARALRPATPACFRRPTSHEETRCATMGVFAPLVGIIGTLQAAEALKLLCGIGTSLAGRLLMLDGRGMEFTEVRIGRQAGCEVCGRAAL